MTKERLIIIILFAYIHTIGDGNAQAIATGQTIHEFSIYVLMGQSNMAGRGKLADPYLDKRNENVWMFTKEKQWIVAKHPLHFDKSVAGVGPGLAFGFCLADFFPSTKTGLVPTAVGGTSINMWQPGVFDSSTKTHPYDDAIERMRAAMQFGTIEGVVWLQGESDASAMTAEVYLAKLKSLVNNIRTATNNPQLPFVVGELGEYKQAYQNFNEAVLKRVASEIPNTMLVRSTNLTDGGDGIHFNSASAEIYGKRFAEAMIQLKKLPGKIPELKENK